MDSRSYLALDVGERRIGVAKAGGGVLIAVPLMTIEVDGSEIKKILSLVESERADVVVIGYPRNQSGDATAQTEFVQAFVDRLPKKFPASIAFQDESLTSVHAEEHLKATKKPYTKGDIDSMAASLILQDYLEQHSGRL